MEERLIGKDIDTIFKRSKVGITPSTSSTAFSKKVLADLDLDEATKGNVNYKQLFLVTGGICLVGVTIYYIWLSNKRNKENKLLSVKAEKYDNFVKEDKEKQESKAFEKKSKLEQAANKSKLGLNEEKILYADYLNSPKIFTPQKSKIVIRRKGKPNTNFMG